LYALGAEAVHGEGAGAAVGADGRQLLGVVAVVADGARGLAVIGHRDVAAAAAEEPAAAPAGDVRQEAAAVEEEDGLLVPLHRRLHELFEAAGDDGVPLQLVLLGGHVDHLDLRHLAALDPHGHPGQAVLAVPRAVDGVALPRMTVAPSRTARWTATSRAW